jgi:hypothetical protein
MFKNILLGNTILRKIAKYLYLLYKYLVNLTHKDFSSYNNDEMMSLFQTSFKISLKGRHCFFGYYDKSPLSIDGDNVIFHSVPILNLKFWLATNCEIVLYKISQNTYNVIDTTSAWNWQQGSMLQWSNSSCEEILYNIMDMKSLKYKAKKLNLLTGDFTIFDLPIYTQSKCGTRFLSLNFLRLDNYAKGYGYKNINKAHNLDDDSDGIWEYNTSTNTIKLLVTINDLKVYESKHDFGVHRHYINHVDYFPDGESIIFIHRWCDKYNIFKSRLFMFNLTNRKLIKLLDNNHVSHFTWSPKNKLLIYATNDLGEKGYFELSFTDNNYLNSDVIKYLPDEDGHPSFFNDNIIVTDTYPDFSRKQNLYVYDINDETLVFNKSFYSPLRYFDENRCDLHPRVCNDKFISIDTTQTGKRTLEFYKINI